MKLACRFGLSSFVVAALLCHSVLFLLPTCLACDEMVPAPAAVATSDGDTCPAATATDRSTNSIATASVDYFGHAHLNIVGGGSVSDGEHTLGDARPEKQFVIIHFNDIYQNEARKQEPCGGVAHTLTAVNRYGEEAKKLDDAPPPLVIFSGDCLGPSSLSTVTQGSNTVVPDIDIILGGHDHHYMVKKLGDVWLCKSGTNMRDLTEIRVTVPAAPAGAVRERPTITTKRISITSDIPPHEDGVKLVAKYEKVMDAKMGDVIARTPVLLDGFSNHIQTRETNLGNLVCDALRAHTQADVALVQAGTFRGDDVLGPTIIVKDLFSMFPYTDTVVSKLVPGRTLVAALEAGVSRIPAHEGCFPQVSGIQFRFDPAKPPFSRIESPVLVGDEELDMEAIYTVVMPAYIGRGKDGYGMLRECEYVGGNADGPALKDVLRAYFSAQPDAINVEWKRDNNSSDSAAPLPAHPVLDGRISQASLVASK